MEENKEERSFSGLAKIIINPILNFAFTFYFMTVFTCYLIQAYIHEGSLAFKGHLLTIGIYMLFFTLLRFGKRKAVSWLSYFICKLFFVLSSPFILWGIFNPEYLNVAEIAIMISLLLDGMGYMFWTISLCFTHGSEILNMDIDTFSKVIRDIENKQK